MKIVPKFLQNVHVIWRIAATSNHYRVDALTWDVAALQLYTFALAIGPQFAIFSINVVHISTLNILNINLAMSTIDIGSCLYLTV